MSETKQERDYVRQQKVLTSFQLLWAIPIYVFMLLFLFVMLGPERKEDRDDSPSGIWGYKKHAFFRTTRFVLILLLTCAITFLMVGLFSGKPVAFWIGVVSVAYCVFGFFVLRERTEKFGVHNR